MPGSVDPGTAFSLPVQKLALQAQPCTRDSFAVYLSHHRESLYFSDAEIVLQFLEAGYPCTTLFITRRWSRWKIDEEFDSSINLCLQVLVDDGKGRRRNSGGESRVGHAASKQRMKLG